MPATYSRYIPIISIIGDFLLLNILFIFGFYYFMDEGQCFAPKYLLFYSYLNLIWFILVFVFGSHKIDRNTSKKSLFFTYLKIIVFFFFLFLIYFQIVPLSYYPRRYIKYIFPLFFALLLAWKFVLYYFFYLYRQRGFNYKNVIILGYTPFTVKLQQYFNTNKWHGYRLLRFFDDQCNDKNQFIGPSKSLKNYLDSNHVDEIYLALNAIPKDMISEITDIISGYPVKIRIVPDLGTFSFKSAELITYGSIPVLQIHPGPLSYWYNKSIKRTFDILLSLVMIIFILSWMTGLLAIASWLGSREGVFFRQRRTCIDGRAFTCIKFRTMKKNTDADHKQVTRDDERITVVGRVLRKYSLDELPQFLNVLVGDMSVVGPRPHMLAHTEEYRKLIDRFMLRHTIKPGITGLAQVNGFRGEIKNLSDLSNRVAHDVQYIEAWSFNLDIKIILLTIWVIIRGQIKAY